MIKNVIHVISPSKICLCNSQLLRSVVHGSRTGISRTVKVLVEVEWKISRKGSSF